MAILDKKLELSDAQALTTKAAGAISTNVIDLGAANIQLGAGTPLYLNVRCNTAAAKSSVKVSVMSHTAADVTAGTTIIEGPVVAKASVTAGAWLLRCSVPYEVLKQYVGLEYLVGATTETTTKIDAWISLDAQSSYGISAEV